MTSIDLSPWSRASTRLLFGLSIRFPRRRNYAVAIGTAARQLSLQQLRFIFQPHPAQFENALDEIIRQAVFRGIVLGLLDRHWHGCPPAFFICCWLCWLRATHSYVAVGPADRSHAAFPACKSCRSHQTVSFDLLGRKID